MPHVGHASGRLAEMSTSPCTVAAGRTEQSGLRTKSLQVGHKLGETTHLALVEL